MKAYRRLKAWAIYPINGGPTSIPTILYVAIIEIAIPGEYFLENPAKRNVIGIIAAVPNPTRQNPIRANQNLGTKTASPMPAKTSTALMIKVFGMPICSINRSEANRDRVIKIIKHK